MIGGASLKNRKGLTYKYASMHMKVMQIKMMVQENLGTGKAAHIRTPPEQHSIWAPVGPRLGKVGPHLGMLLGLFA